MITEQDGHNLSLSEMYVNVKSEDLERPVEGRRGRDDKSVFVQAK